MVRIFLTGGGGYLGSTLLGALPKDWEVVSLGRKPPATPLPRSVTFLSGDLTSPDWDPKAVRGCDAILHLAAVKGADLCARQPVEAVEVNVLGTHRLIRAALAHQVRRFIFASTYWVYGERNEPPYNEGMRVAPDELYGFTKAVSEMELARSGLEYTVLRFANIFGQGAGRGREEVIFHFITGALRGAPLILDGDGLQELDFIDVADVARILAVVVMDPRASREIFNIGSGRPVSILDLTGRVRSLVHEMQGTEATLEHRGPPPPHRIRRFVSMEKFRRTFPEILPASLDESLRRYIALRESELHGPGC
jgi:nucleoside-diphosphate-sugar epimerase